MDVPVECVLFLLSDAARGLTGKTISASFDPWHSPVFENNIEALGQSDLYTMRRINLVNLGDEGVVAALTAAPRRK
jgi:hypothetical protein